MANWGANFVVTISFLTLLSALGNAGTFFLFAGLSVVALAYFQRQVPETKNRSLQDIERDLDLSETLDNRQHRPVSHARPLSRSWLTQHSIENCSHSGGGEAARSPGLTTGVCTTTARAATAALALPAGDGPPGFWWGTDSLPVTVPGSAPYQMPYLGGASGAYPYGWCLDHGAGPCAQFFGGQTSSSPHALMWQWSGGGGVTNGIGGFNGDLDTIDAIRQN